jgi:hypothetical protein
LNNMMMTKIYVPLYSHGKWENTNTSAYLWISILSGSWYFSKGHV